VIPVEAAIAFAAGVLTFVAPCTLPVLPIVVGAGVAGGRRRPAGVVIGFGASFVLLSILLASLLARAGLAASQLRVASALALALVGAVLAFPLLGRRLEAGLGPLAHVAPSLASRSDGLLDGLAIGAAIGVVWAPCVGPIMAAVLVAAATGGATAATVAIAAAYAAGAALPLLAVAVLGRRAISAAGSPETRFRIRQAFGALMVVASVVVATGYDTSLERTLSAMTVGGQTPDPASPRVASAPFAATDPRLPTPIASGLPASTQLDDLGLAPELTGITVWINSPPLTIAALQGKVVLVHFWTFACINCLHVQPYVKAWYARYASAGLVVVGVHTPELSFERDVANVRRAVADDGVTFPVAFDPAYATWNAYGNSYWPAFYLVDRSGRIRHTHFGEGDYGGSEEAIRELLLEPG
jgi:cytochrome c biogenesis protein CcdA/thiol-disulfide isomerase/thioredoxin